MRLSLLHELSVLGCYLNKAQRSVDVPATSKHNPLCLAQKKASVFPGDQNTEERSRNASSFVIDRVICRIFHFRGKNTHFRAVFVVVSHLYFVASFRVAFSFHVAVSATCTSRPTLVLLLYSADVFHESLLCRLEGPGQGPLRLTTQQVDLKELICDALDEGADRGKEHGAMPVPAKVEEIHHAHVWELAGGCFAGQAEVVLSGR
mmetsp:Transcript_53920/g.92778  ORF Transcript_53920/g.92778 Transcript_53920/m.92778 type:complete len:205 (-) Transcript_53920:101-715(-)